MSRILDKRIQNNMRQLITEVQVQFDNESPAWIPYETLIAIQKKNLL